MHMSYEESYSFVWLVPEELSITLQNFQSWQPHVVVKDTVKFKIPNNNMTNHRTNTDKQYNTR
jgi:hypothetical protein